MIKLDWRTAESLFDKFSLYIGKPEKRGSPCFTVPVGRWISLMKWDSCL